MKFEEWRQLLLKAQERVTNAESTNIPHLIRFMLLDQSITHQERFKLLLDEGIYLIFLPEEYSKCLEVLLNGLKDILKEIEGQQKGLAEAKVIRDKSENEKVKKASAMYEVIKLIECCFLELRKELDSRRPLGEESKITLGSVSVRGFILNLETMLSFLKKFLESYLPLNGCEVSDSIMQGLKKDFSEAKREVRRKYFDGFTSLKRDSNALINSVAAFFAEEKNEIFMGPNADPDRMDVIIELDPPRK